jgi:hypothetical protein
MITINTNLNTICQILESKFTKNFRALFTKLVNESSSYLEVKLDDGIFYVENEQLKKILVLMFVQKYHLTFFNTENGSQINYGVHAMNLSNSAINVGGFNHVYIANTCWYDADFAERNKEILSVKTGSGLWLWKPYVIKKMLNKMQNGEILCYVDSLYQWTENFGDVLVRVVDSKHNGMMLFHNKPNEPTFMEKNYTKKEVLDYFNCSEEMKNSNQVWAGCVILQKNERTVKLVNDWLEHAEKPELIIDPETRNGQLPEFKEHRRDQSILSILAKREGVNFETFPKKYLQNLRVPY